MKYWVPFLLVLLAAFSFCTVKNADDFEFGIKYNPTRLKFGSPLIKRNMVAQNCCGNWTVYMIDKKPLDNQAYHSSKTMRVIIDGRLAEEKDIYRKNLDDSTILQLNILTIWPKENGSLNFQGNVGKLDSRVLNLKATDFMSGYTKYPNYEFTTLNQPQIDSVLNLWGLSRSDKE
jgi:hypothetical protein